MALRNQEIGARLRELRGQKPQTTVAEDLGVAERTYQNWEAGDAKPSYRNLQRLAHYFGVGEDFILTGQPASNGNSDNGDAGPTPDPFNAPDTMTERLDRIERRLNEIYALLTGQSDPAAEHRHGIVHPDPPADAQDQPPAPPPNDDEPK